MKQEFPPSFCMLKLGGSLITDKDKPHTARLSTIQRLAQEIARARQDMPGLHLILGHGSGSFGHVPAKKYATRQGVYGAEQWLGFAKVWKEARELNQVVVSALLETGLPIIAFPPSAAILSNHGTPQTWDLRPIYAALNHQLIPLVFGDVVFDTQQGGTILSTEELFIHLARQQMPQRILLAGIEAGVWEDFPNCTRLLQQITPASFNQVAANVKQSASIDVTGGMQQKVKAMLDLAALNHHFEALIFSGDQPENVYQALCGGAPGTLIKQSVE